MPISPPTLAGATGEILLVEGYPALGVAFKAAIKRVAPAAIVRLFPSLKEGATAAAEKSPTLIIIDIDPPHRGTVAFLNQLAADFPQASVVIIAARNGVAGETQGAFPSALRFLGKPFQLAELEAAIEPALMSPAPAVKTNHRTLRHLALGDFVLLHTIGAATAVLGVRAAKGGSGEIHFRDGRICHAATSGHLGMEALEEIFNWPATTCADADWRPDAPRTIHGEWRHTLAKVWRPVGGIQPLGEHVVATPDARATLPTPRPRKKLFVVDDTEMLLIFVGEILATANPDYDIQTAKVGVEGLARITATKPDLVLLDYSLPDITGAEVCRQLLENPVTADIPIIIMSGHVVEMQMTSERYPNVIATIAKPFLSTSLLELVERTIAELPQVRGKSKNRKKVELPQSQKPEAKATTDGAPIDGANGREEQLAEIVAPPEATEAPEGSIAVPPPPAFPPPPTTPPPSASLIPPPAYSEKLQASSNHPHLPPLQICGSPSSSGLAPAAIQAAKYNAVVLHLPLEVVSLQFSPSLRMKSIRARPSSHLVSLHILPQALPGAVISEAGFEIVRVDLDSRGQMDVVHLAPTRPLVPRPETVNDMPVGTIVVLPSASGQTVELTPAPVAQMQMELFALFELCGVELSPEFGVSHLLLKARGRKMRVSLQPDATQSGATFRTAQILLDGSARIAEVLLDTLD